MRWQEKWSRWLIRFILIGLLVAAETMAGTTGKIIDAKTKEPLVGVNVVVVGTTLGAATDLEGSYFILNLPPGVYQVKASLIGYGATVMNNVKVSIDLTTKLDFALAEEAVSLGEVVVGGLVFSTVVTLLVLPTICVLIDDLRTWARGVVQRAKVATA